MCVCVCVGGGGGGTNVFGGRGGGKVMVYCIYIRVLLLVML